MSDHPESGTPEPSSPPAPMGGGPSGDRPELLHLQDVVRMIEDARQMNLSTDETQRQKFLKQLKSGEFPPPSKPADRLPRVEKYGEIQWAECWWQREDVEEWLKGDAPKEKWDSRWARLKIKPWRDLPSLASFAAQRVCKGTGDWEHWADHYHARAYTGTVLRFVVWAAIWGWICFVWLPTFNEPLVERNQKGEVQYEENIFVLADGREVFREIKDTATNQLQIRYRVINDDGTLGAEVAESDIALVKTKAEDGTEAEARKKAEKFKYRKKKEKDVEQYIYAEGHKDAGKPITDELTAYAKRKLAAKERSLFSFLNADLSQTFGFQGATVPLLIFIILAGVPGLITLYKFLYFRLTVKYALTDSLLKVRQGLLQLRESQVRVIQIQDMAVHQSLTQRIFGVGDINVHSDDVDEPDLTIMGVRDPVSVKDRLFQVSEAAKTEKRYYIESTGGGGRAPAPPR